MTRQSIQMMLSQWTRIIIFLTLMQVKRQEGHFSYRLQCKPFGRVTQAVRTNFSVTLISSCEEGSNLYRCEITYNFHVGVTADALQITTSPDGPRTNITMHAGLIIKYEWTMIEDGRRRSVMFNLTISSSDDPVTVHLKTQSQRDCVKIQDLGSIYFKGCDHHTEFGSISTSSKFSRYLDMGHISCNNKNAVSGRAVFSNGSEAVQTQCLADATWKDVNNITCRYPIKVELRIKGIRYSETVNLTYNHSAYGNNTVLLNCSTKDEAMSAVTKFTLNNKLLNSPSITLHPNLNRKNVSCYLENDFVKYFPESIHTYSSTSTLNIRFGPHPPKGLDSLCAFPDGSIAFYSSPSATGRWLSLRKGDAEVPSTITLCCGRMYGVHGQMIAPRYNQKEPGNWSLRANLFGHEYYTVVPCENMTTVSGDSSMVIAIACLGAALLLATGIILICCKRWSNGNTKIDVDKVENSNPLYGTSDDAHVEPKSNEQVMNPLYGTTSSDQNDTEVYYVAYNKEEKGLNKSQEPTGDTGDLYSVVDKRKT